MSYYDLALEKYLDDQNYLEPVCLDGRRGYRPPLYRRERLEEPVGFLDPTGKEAEIDAIVKFSRERGFWAGYPKISNPELKQHVLFFRNNLELYDMIVKDKVFCVQEIYERCLVEKLDFTDYIKKSRAFSLQAKESIEGVEDSEYVHPEYSGYDSIIHERYLINWDDSKIIWDWPYSTIPAKQIDEDEFRQYANRMLRDCGQLGYDFPDVIRVIDQVSGKMTSRNDKQGSTTLLKNAWGTEGTGPWLAIRRVVPTQPGKTRDTGVPDIETLNHLKLIHLHTRNIAEKQPNSANCKLMTLQKRVERIMKGRLFMHLDFKKFGLTAQRELANIMLEEMGKPHLKVPDVYLQVGSDIYKTKRGGGSLGWLDPLFSLCVSAILRGIQYKYGWRDMDHITFNDDVEIAFLGEITAEEALLRKDIICDEVESFGFMISYRKVYISEMMVFLEDYHNAQECNMDKLQLAGGLFAKSLSTAHHWKAKLLFSEGWARVRSIEIKELCQNTLGSDETDNDRPIEVGGWIKYTGPDGLNRGLTRATPREMEFFMRISRYKEPHLMPKWELLKVENLWRGKEAKINESITYSPSKDEVQGDEPQRLTEQAKEAYLLYRKGEPEIPPPLPERQSHRYGTNYDNG